MERHDIVHLQVQERRSVHGLDDAHLGHWRVVSADVVAHTRLAVHLVVPTLEEALQRAPR